ncbi:MAG: hypothetical protein Q9P90_11285 [candidate division KSB1 bacterium]|nr:hypothetical protein [candidate division KSB1 bacterium]
MFAWKRFGGLGLAAVLALSACNLSVNESITVADEETHNGSINAVNGNIIIGKNAVVKGDCRAVNGNIFIDQGATARKAMSVSGGIEIRDRARIERSVESVNGPVQIGREVDIFGTIKSINGSIELVSSYVEKDITTINGNISLLDGSRVRGDIIIKENKGSEVGIRRIKIVLQKGSVVEGDILVKDKNVEVKVFLDASSAVKGQVVGAEVVQS